jgi:uncharacterized protein
MKSRSTETLNWHFPRPELAKYYLDAMFVQGVQRLAFFGRRRIGKTEFLLRDVIPLAEKNGVKTLYCSLWEHKDKPHLSITQALERAAPRSKDAFSRVQLRLALPDVAEAEIEVERATQPKAASAEELASLTANWRNWLDSLKKKQALVVFDEIQHLATSARFATFAATLRTLLDVAPSNVRVVFTGSSHADLQRLFTNSRAPFYHFADIHAFAPMSHDFVSHLEAVFHQITSLTLPSAQLGDVFELTGRNAHLLVGLTQRLVIFKTTDVQGVWSEISHDLIGPEGWCVQLWQQLSLPDRVVYQQLLHDQEPFSETSLEIYAQANFSRASAQKALLRLENKGLISRLGHGQYMREIPLLDQWLQRQR